LTDLSHISVNPYRSPLPWFILEFLTVGEYMRIKRLNCQTYYTHSSKGLFGTNTTEPQRQRAMNDMPAIQYLIRIGNLNQMPRLQNTGLRCQLVRMNVWKECLINNQTMHNFLNNKKYGLKDKNYDKLVANL